MTTFNWNKKIIKHASTQVHKEIREEKDIKNSKL